MALKTRPLAAFAAIVMALVLPLSLVAQQPPNVRVATGATATMVWSYAGATTQCGGGNDYADVPARPFLVGGNVLWFAGNSNGFASVGTGGVDILATLQRGLQPGTPTCVQWLTGLSPDTPQPYRNAKPNSYSMAYWMVAPFFDGTIVYALVHNEFHGEWTGNTALCPVQQALPYMPCNYWNIMSVSSRTSGAAFELNQASGTNVPAIALGNPYLAPLRPSANTQPQGMTAQSNIIQEGSYLYVLAQQLQAPGAPNGSLNGVCLYQAELPISPGGTLTWLGWDGLMFSVAVPPRYPTTDQPLCKSVLASPFRFSLSFSKALGQYIAIGQDAVANIAPGRKVDCPLAPDAPPGADTAFVYMTLPPGWLQNPQMAATTPETCLLLVNPIQAGTSGYRQAYPSLLDPTSPQLTPGDVNFMYSGASPYLYFTQIYPIGTANQKGYQRDLMRIQLSVAYP